MVPAVSHEKEKYHKVSVPLPLTCESSLVENVLILQLSHCISSTVEGEGARDMRGCSRGRHA